MMFPDQRERIRLAARELSAALTEAGDDFIVEAVAHEVTQVGDERRRYAYAVTVEATQRELIQ